MKTLNVNKKAIVWAMVFGLLFTLESFSAGVLHINSENQVTGDTIYVKDLATIDASDPLLLKIGDIKIASSPQPGKKKNIPSGLIKSRIQSAMPDGGPEIVFSQKKVTIERQYQVLSETVLQSIFKDYVGRKLNGAKIKISGIKIQGNQKFPLGKLSLKVEDVGDKKISGHLRLIVNAGPEGGKKKRLMVSGWVDRYETVVFARHEISKGDVLKESSLYTELTNITKYPPDLFKSTAFVTGQTAKLKIRKNVLLRQKMIEISPDIRKNEIVKMLVKSGSLTVVTIGRAMGNARIGDQVRVRNIKSKKIITGFVLDSKTIEIIF